MRRLLLLLTWLIIASICSVQVIEAKCRIKPKCRRLKGACQAECNEDGEWAAPNGCKARGQTPPADCKCCTSRCQPKAWCKKRAGLCIKTNQCENGTLYPTKCNGPICSCCVKPKDVKASFILTNEEYSKELRNPSSDKYKDLKRKIEQNFNSAFENDGEITGFQVEFFRNGTVIVDAKISTTEEVQEVANRMVLEALIQSGVKGLDTSSVSVGVRLCVPVKGKCAKMPTAPRIKSLPIICVEARDVYDCLQRLKNKEVDLVRGDAADVYLADEIQDDELRVIAETRDEDKEDDKYQHEYVAVVRRSTISGLADLEGSKFCSPGYGTTAGWYVPISKLENDGEITLNCSGSASVVEKTLRTVSSYFGDACIPGKWAPDHETNTRLKEKYSNLCSLCDDPIKCSKEDKYYGDEGALKCLTDETGDVAWVKLDAVLDLDNSEFGLLCENGDIDDIGPDACNWASKPWPAWLTWKSSATHGDNNALVLTLDNLVVTLQANWLKWGKWAEDVLGINEYSIINKLKPRISPYNYLNQAGYYTVISWVGCPATVRLCVVGAEAEQKCKELGEVLKSRQLRPNLACVVRTDEATCVDAIANHDADIIALDGGDIFKAYSDHDLIPVISEVYGDSQVSYYAVAAVRDGSTISSLADLQGKKSCHTGIMKSAGWKVPVMRLLDAKLLNESKCDYAKQMGNFFSESCAPGANSPKYDCDGTNPTSLCSLCVGNEEGEYKCARDSNERYYGYSGALRCLVEGAGDVAFIKHTTVPGNANLTFDDDDKWNQKLDSSNYKLLCLNGTQQEVSAYKSCNWASVPSHKVVTRNDINGALQENVRILLLRAAEILPLGNDVFAMYGKFDGEPDVIFKSSATNLVNFSENDFHQLREGDYWQALLKLKTCEC